MVECVDRRREGEVVEEEREIEGRCRVRPLDLLDWFWRIADREKIGHFVDLKTEVGF